MDLTTHLRNSLSDGKHDCALCVAYSGGADSTALLHALAQLPQARARGMRAAHIDHGLHADSAHWSLHCERFCAAIDVPLTVLHVEVDISRGEGLEAAARRARYDAIAGVMREGEWLALAHHRDDQVETVLLKLLRGAGPEGLGGMRPIRVLHGKSVWRPLLDVPRSVLRDYVEAHRLAFIEDPSNADPRHSRNFLRHEILPRLTQHWPHAADSIAHSATLSRLAADRIELLIEDALVTLHCDENALDAADWSALPDALRAGVLERWLHGLKLPAPSGAQGAELKRQIDEAQADRVPRVAWPGAEVRVWRGGLHAMPPLPATPVDWESTWDGSPLALPAGCGTLTLQMSNPGNATKLDPLLTVRFRRGGERIKPAGDRHIRELRDLFQHADIPPWQRKRIPLIYSDGELLAVADIWLSETGKVYFERIGARPRWNLPSIDSFAPLR
ncbi:MAG: tRNA lysidine(34) synthetase TilS [Rhodanobacteraceae bacterium]